MQNKIFSAFGIGLNLLPSFVVSVETLLGKKTGQAKKDAVTTLVNASITGAAAGFGIAGDANTGQALVNFAPVISQTIDAVAAAFFPSGSTKPAPAPASAATPAQVS